MSLFGSSPPDASSAAASRTKSSLFDDDAAAGSRSSLFDDGLAATNDPWGMPTPRSNRGRGVSYTDTIGTIMRSANIPDQYVDMFDVLVRESGVITVADLTRLLGSSRASTKDQDKILTLVAGRDRDESKTVTRDMFNMFLALVAVSEQGDEDLGFDAVDDRKRNLPIPSIASKPAAVAKSSNPAPQFKTQLSDIPSRAAGMSATSERTDDPWGSPEVHVGHNHADIKANGNTFPSAPEVGSLDSASITPSRPSYSQTPSQLVENDDLQASLHLPRQPTMDAWGGPPVAGGFVEGQTDTGSLAGSSIRPTYGSASRIATGSRIEEVITVTALSDKEGMFMFQHRNYQVASSRRGSRVIRRYSDFVWLLDCLQKRYPFRQLPILPPKRLAADNAFIERRKRGLARFANALVRHPILKDETLVVMFLTVPTELAVWRKQATISVMEEFVDRPLPPNLEESLPADLEATFETVRSGIKRSAETYIGLCNLLERIEKRHEGIAADYRRFSGALESLTDMSEATYKVDTSEIALLNDGLVSVSKHFNTAQSIMEDEIKAWDAGVLEDLKRHRDALVAMRELFERKDKYAVDNIPYLEKRIRTTEDKLANTRNKPAEQRKPGEVEKLESSIAADKDSIVKQQARNVLIKECVRDELMFFQGSQYHVSRLQQDWAQERIKYAELYADNWKALGNAVEGMPLGE